MTEIGGIGEVPKISVKPVEKKSFKTDFISKTKEKTPFGDSSTQFFLSKWFEVNDSIKPKFVSRQEYEAKLAGGILRKNEKGGKQILFVPDDLKLYEIVDFIKVVDNDTYANSPELKDQRVDKIMALGKTFEQAGIYLNSYLPQIDQGKGVASDISKEFYNYGLLLQQKTKVADNIIPVDKLSKEDKQQVDKWLLGDKVYQKQMSKLGENPTPEQIEERRHKNIKTIFTALDNPKYSHFFVDKIEQGITTAIETPQKELTTSVFDRGVENLVKNMKMFGYKDVIEQFLKEGVGLDLAVEQTKLYNSLKIPELKQELDELREKGNIEEISQKELEIAKKIQQAVHSFKYNENGNNPSKMIKTQRINCLGSAILCGGLLDKLGIKYLSAELPGHAATVLITSDNKAYWQDFTPGEHLEANYQEITPDMLEKNVDIASILNKKDGSIQIEFKEFDPYFGFIEDMDFKLKVNLSRPEIGLQAMLLFNTGIDLADLGKHEEAIEFYKQGINLDPNFIDYYSSLKDSLSHLDRREEAIEAYLQIIRLDPTHKHYSYLGDLYNKFDRNEEAIEAYLQAIRLNSKIPRNFYHLGDVLSKTGNNKEAIKNYKNFISLWAGDESWIDKAREKIKLCEEKLSS